MVTQTIFCMGFLKKCTSSLVLLYFVYLYKVVYVLSWNKLNWTQHTFKHMLCWRQNMLCWEVYHAQHTVNICCVGGKTCCVGRLTMHNTLSTYVVLVVNMLCRRLTIHNTLSTYVVCKSLVHHRRSRSLRHIYIVMIRNHKIFKWTKND